MHLRSALFLATLFAYCDWSLNAARPAHPPVYSPFCTDMVLPSILQFNMSNIDCKQNEMVTFGIRHYNVTKTYIDTL